MQPLIEQYLASDEEQRLMLFLDHRDLRRQFIEIDMAALKATSGQKPATESLPRRCESTMFYDACLGWFKRCWTAR
jgi:hypothetical protein